MSFSETPAMTDAEELKAGIQVVLDKLDDIESRLDTYRDALNAQGENIAWLVQNTQGIFQTLSNPALISQMMGSVMGGFTSGSQSDSESGTASGADA